MHSFLSQSDCKLSIYINTICQIMGRSAERALCRHCDPMSAESLRGMRGNCFTGLLLSQ